MVISSIEIPIYGNMFHVAIIEDFQKEYSEFNKKFRDTLTEKNDVLGFTLQKDGHILIMINIGKHTRIFKKQEEKEVQIVSTICHEAVHACNALFIDKGVELDLVNDEPQAYLIDWFTKEIYKTYLKTDKK